MSAREEATEEWRRLNKEELNDVYCSTDIIRASQPRRKEMGGVGTTYGKRKRCVPGFVGKSEGKRQFGIPRRRR